MQLASNRSVQGEKWRIGSWILQRFAALGSSADLYSAETSRVLQAQVLHNKHTQCSQRSLHTCGAFGAAH